MTLTEDKLEKWFHISTNVVRAIAIVRILLVCWDMFVPKSKDDVLDTVALNLLSKVIPVDFSDWGILIYIFLESWWVLKCMVMLWLIYTTIGYFIKNKVGSGIAMSLLTVVGLYIGVHYNQFQSPRFTQQDGIIGFSFSNKVMAAAKPSSFHQQQGIVAYGIVKTDEPILSFNREFPAPHIVQGDTVYITELGQKNMFAPSIHYSTILHYGRKVKISVNSYDLIEEEAQSQDRLYRLFSDIAHKLKSKI